MFHLFQEDDQLRLARGLGALLSPEPGSMIFGSHGVVPQTSPVQSDDDRKRLFSHSPDSWTELWDGGVFERGTVRVNATVAEIDVQYKRAASVRDTRACWLQWSVTRL